MKKSPFRILAIVMTLPVFLGAGCAWKSDVEALAQEVQSQRTEIEKVRADAASNNKRAQDTATAALKNAETAATAAQKAGQAAEAANIQLARLLAKPDTAVYALEFGFNKSRVSFAMGRQLDQILTEWQSKAAKFQVVGHADSVGKKSQNLALSRKRANAVKAALVRRGIPSSMVSAVGVGQQDPAVQTSDGKRLRANRVVVLTIVAKKA